MTREDNIANRYFEWMLELMCDDLYAESISYRKLLTCLHTIEFRWDIPRDANRAEDGIDLRRRFALLQGDETLCDFMDEPSSVLEMMIALAIRCEESIMDDPNVGDRTRQWFWGMINNLGLGAMYDSNFDKIFVRDVVNRFLDRKYEPNGRGGLFTVRGCNQDLRDVEIWYQLCWYLDTIV